MRIPTQKIDTIDNLQYLEEHTQVTHDLWTEKLKLMKRGCPAYKNEVLKIGT